MVRVCNGADLPAGNPSRIYLLRTHGDVAHQIYNVANPSNPTLLTTIVSGLEGTHKSWWECDTGIAYLVSGVPGWRTDRMTQVFDLSSPESPVHIRDYGLVGQEPTVTVLPVPTDVHGPISLGQRVYFGHGTSTNGIAQIVDRTKLLTGPPEPTPDNLRFPVIAQVHLSPLNGAHTTFPVLGIPVPQLGEFAVPPGGTRDILVVVNEATGNRCSGAHQMVYFMDITREDKPQIISNYHVPEEPGNFCSRGGRFGAHASNENMTPIYYGRVVFVSYFNAGVRAIDIRNPFKPVELGYFIPSLTSKAIPVGGTKVIQTNNVEVDNRGYWAPCFFYLARRLKRAGVAVILICHNVVEHETAAWKRQVTRIVLGQASSFVAQSRHDRSNIVAFLPDARIAVHAHPILDQFRSLAIRCRASHRWSCYSTASSGRTRVSTCSWRRWATSRTRTSI